MGRHLVTVSICWRFKSLTEMLIVCFRLDNREVVFDVYSYEILLIDLCSNQFFIIHIPEL